MSLLGLLQYVFAPLLPQVQIPQALSSSNDPNLVWSNEEYINYVKSDKLSWGESIRFQTASTIISIAQQAQEESNLVSCPFLVFQDPLDAVTLMDGVTHLLSKSSTAESDKLLIEVIGGRHDVISNRLGFFIEHLIAWLEKQ